MIICKFSCSARWIGNHGFSIGIDDVQPKWKLNQDKAEKILSGYKKCDIHIHSYNEGKLKLQPGCNAVQTLEAVITKELNDIREATAKVSTNILAYLKDCGTGDHLMLITASKSCLINSKIVH